MVLRKSPNDTGMVTVGQAMSIFGVHTVPTHGMWMQICGMWISGRKSPMSSEAGSTPVEPEVRDLDGVRRDEVDGAVGQGAAHGVGTAKGPSQDEPLVDWVPSAATTVEKVLGRALVDGGNDL